ncbi:hypothetical protein [Micromonospora sp. NPDC002575]|uniref:hypothetical protein n=1 Tax=Micromonospora sp. NPDC002575 TaxID=3364222 RepID=UPI00367B6327
MVKRHWQVSGTPELTDHRGRRFRPTELEIVVIDGGISTTTVHGLLSGTHGPHGGRHTDRCWYGPWEWQIPPIPDWIEAATRDQP